MSIRNRVIRIFVSSTFEDMRIERDVLQRKVYPYLLSLCAPRGWQVDFVDLRWGISKEAGVQQKTMRICLEELRRCREVSPRPNFLILQGQRYGWCPLPETIEARYWADVELAARAEGVEELLHRWYRRDDNNVPPHYELRGKDEFPDRHYDTDYEVYEREVEMPLRAVMRRFAASHPDMPYDVRCHFVASATEQEIMQGALSNDVVPQQVAAFIRTVTDLDTERYEGPLLDARRQRDEARAAIERLKTKVESRLATERQAVCHYDLTLREYLSNDYKAEVEQRLKQLLENLVLREMEDYERKKPQPWEVERYRQEAFVDQRTKFFCGREDVLERMTAFVDGRERLFCLEGASGTGKSSVMAMVYRRLSQRDDLVVLFRSIGEGSSTSGQAVLRTMLQELRGHFHVEGLSDDMDKMSYGELVEQCHRLMYTYNGRTLVLMIDAMDQLPKFDPLRSFDWMPPYAEGRVRVVVSRISDNRSAPLPAAGIWRLGNLADEGREGGRRILLENMAAVGRTLGKDQQKAVLDLYERGGYHPIYLKLLAGIASEWHDDAVVEAGDDYTLTMRDGRQRVTLPLDVARLTAGYFALLGSEGRHGLIVRDVLAFLVLTRRGVSDGEVQRLLALDEDFMDYFRKNAFHDYKAVNVGDESLLPLAFPSSIWTRFYYDIRFLLADHIVVGGAVNGFNHRQVYEGAKMYLESVHFDEEAAFRLLTTYFGERYRLHDVRALEELPRVLKKSGRIEEQMQLLEDIDFIQGKVQNGLVFDLMSDYRVALETGTDFVGQEFPLDHPSIICGKLSDELYKHLLDQAVIARHMQTIEVLMDFVAQELPTFVDFAAEHVQFTLQLMHNIWADGPLASLAAAYMERAGSTLPEMYLRINRPRFVKHHLLMQKQQGHSWCVNALAVSGDGRTVLTASDDRKCIVWDMVQRKPLRTYFGHRAQVSALAVSSDMSEAYSGSWDGTVLQWHVASGLTRHSYPCEDGGRVTALVTLPDGGCVAGYSSGRCRWLVDGGERLSLRLPAWVTAMLLHQDLLWVGLADGTVHRVGLGGSRRGSSTLDGEVRCLVARSDGSVTASTAKGRFYQLDGRQVHPLFDMPLHEHLCPNDFRFSLSEYADLMAVVVDYDIRLLTLEGKEKYTIHGHSKDVAAVHMLADGRRLFSAGRDKYLMMWDLGNLDRQEAPVDNPDYVRWFDKLVYLSRQTSRMEVVAASTNGRIVRWASKERRGTLLAEGVGPIYAIDVAPDGHTALCSGGDSEVFMIDLDDAAHKTLLPRVHTTFVNAVRISPTGRRAATNAIDEDGSGAGTVLTIWDMQSLQPMHRLSERDLTGHDPYPVGGEKSDSGIHPVTGRYKYSRLADAPTMDNIVYINGSHGVAFSPCGHLLAVACRDSKVALLDVESGRVLRRLGRLSLLRDNSCHSNEVKAVAFSPDGRYLFSGAWDDSMIMWDLYAPDGHEFVIRMVGHRRGIYSIDVAADGKTVVSGANDHSFIIWNINRMLELSAQGLTKADYHDGVAINRVIFDANCNSVAFTRDGVVAGLGSGDVAVVDNSKGETLRDVPFVTAIRSTDTQSHYVVCPCCGSKVVPPSYKLDRILAQHSSTIPSLAPSTLSSEALSMVCPSCHNILRINHFIAD